MTHRQLLKVLQTMPDEQLDTDLTIVNLDQTEVFPILDFVHNWEATATEREKLGLDIVDGVLDDNHPYFTYAE